MAKKHETVTILYNTTFTKEKYSMKISSKTKESEKSISRSNVMLDLPIPSFSDTTNYEYVQADATMTALNLQTYFGYQLKKGIGGLVSNDYVQAVANNQNIAYVDSTANKFKAINPRTFTFSWEFTPLTQEESVEIIKIILAFKMFSLPTTRNLPKVNFKDVSNNLTLDNFDKFLEAQWKMDRSSVDTIIRRITNSYEQVIPPDYWEITPVGFEKDSLSSWMLSHILKCYITDVSVSYAGNYDDGLLTTFDDGTPTKMTLTVTFTERNEQRRDYLRNAPLTSK